MSNLFPHSLPAQITWNTTNLICTEWNATSVLCYSDVIFLKFHSWKWNGFLLCRCVYIALNSKWVSWMAQICKRLLSHILTTIWLKGMCGLVCVVCWCCLSQLVMQMFLLLVLTLFGVLTLLFSLLWNKWKRNESTLYIIIYTHCMTKERKRSHVFFSVLMLICDAFCCHRNSSTFLRLRVTCLYRLAVQCFTETSYLHAYNVQFLHSVKLFILL